MRIKINDKIYRLKEIESGVDSLMELVEEQKYKHGDFLMSPDRLAFIFDREGKNGEAHYLFATDMDGTLCDDIQERGTGARYCGYLKNAVLADQEAIKIIHDGLKSIGKRWNSEKKCVEDIPKRKFKAGDKVRIKEGVSSKTNRGEYPCFAREMDDIIGKTMTVGIYTDVGGYVVCNEHERWLFHEDWLEPYEELKWGDLAIFWDSDQSEARIGVYSQFRNDPSYPYEDHIGNGFKNAVKFESKKQFKRFIKGEL